MVCQSSGLVTLRSALDGGGRYCPGVIGVAHWPYPDSSLLAPPRFISEFIRLSDSETHGQVVVPPILFYPPSFSVICITGANWNLTIPFTLRRDRVSRNA